MVRPRDLERRAPRRDRRLDRPCAAARARVEGSVKASGGISPPPCREGQGWGSRGRTSAFRGCAWPPIQSTLVPPAAFYRPDPPPPPPPPPARPPPRGGEEAPRGPGPPPPPAPLAP